MKTPWVRCKFCRTSVSNTTNNIENHLKNCSILPSLRTEAQHDLAGNLIEAVHTPESNETGHTINTNSPQRNIVQKVSPLAKEPIICDELSQKMTTELQNELDLLFSRAINSSATAFSHFNKSVWSKCFQVKPTMEGSNTTKNRWWSSPKELKWHND